MALKTLKGVVMIGGFGVLEIKGRISPEEYAEALKSGKYVCVNHEANSISFTMQKNPVNEGGVNGCQVDTLIHAAEKIISEFNVPPHNSHENDKVLYHLREALNWLNFRRMDREKRKVEGTSAA